mmetsp:Transcript_19698/g.39939  ORF Transcript_19698/g.39939 Transcript_19698/m.39939 type:complete len:224 (+) Transcript_19698:154-825(+)|eukprot:CAMPEP_0183302112 /NCGR_PEP_ID=MMETSP0160_2-20130417/8012_1 /TAXON_ID=2839 ORGANISM="Odontella Sinensis, Strain Grunow 1884" /NCGR_SAMPLE_ID=MMETSP0160_2 /ASSEMBLY_ACC=CAM_ASM_000250 /LENGTH=223 /DNA_ID=CAMNT_0025464839 /DNA_START=122 /DNA_END=793 /DNA_ORIENTATION=-
MVALIRLACGMIGQESGLKRGRKSKILDLIEKKKWASLRELMDKCPSFPLDVEEDHLHQDLQAPSALHILCENQPPLDLVQSFMDRRPEFALQRDYLHQTPLHVAISCGASLSVIHCLLMECPEASELQDHLGRTPLMIACDSLFLKPDYSCLVEVLMRVSGNSVLATDAYGRTALDVAISSQASSEITDCLRHIQATKTQEIYLAVTRHQMKLLNFLYQDEI